MNANAQALALAVAKAARAGDRAAVIRLLSAAHAASDTGTGTDTFADAPAKKGSWGMNFVNWLTGKNKDKERDAEHAREHAKHIAGFEDVQEAGQLSETERLVYSGELIHLISSNVYSIRYDRMDGRGDNRVYVTFRDGSVYRYRNVPWNVVMDEVQNDSPGRGIWRWFREGTKPYKSKYDGKRIGQVSLTRAERKTPVIHIISKGPKKKP